MAKEQRQALEEWLDPLREEYPDVEVVEQLPDEPPVIALARASDRADLLVVGSRGLGRLPRSGARLRQPPPPAVLPSCSSPRAPWQSFAHGPEDR
jgi:nucleotide-binding universal stress UspA family protein